MGKTVAWMVVLVWVTSTIFLQGCAVSKPFARKDLQSISPLKVVRHDTPEIRKISVGRTILGAALGAVLLGGAGAVIGMAILQERMGPEDNVQDFGLLVEKKFVERAHTEIPIWPTMDVLEQPVANDYAEKCALLEFKVNRIAIGKFEGGGLSSITIVTMKDSNGDVLWEKSFNYLSNDFGRGGKSIDDFLSEDKKLLKEELEFAADKTVSDFIAHFKAGI